MHEMFSLGGSETHILTLGAAPLPSVLISPGDMVVSGVELGIDACTVAAVADSPLLGRVEVTGTSRDGRKSQITILMAASRLHSLVLESLLPSASLGWISEPCDSETVGGEVVTV